MANANFSKLVNPENQKFFEKNDELSNCGREIGLFDFVAQGFAKAVGTQDTVQADGSLNVLRYGHVLRAKNLVSVRGGTHPFDGIYYVDQVTHTIERGKFTQSFKLIRDALVSTVPLAPMVS